MNLLGFDVNNDKTDLNAEKLEIGKYPNSYTMPLSRGNDQDILKTDGNGLVSWVEVSGLNPFNQSLNTPDDVKFNSVDTPDLVSTSTFMEFNSLNGNFRFGNNTVSTTSMTLYGDNVGLADFTLANSSGSPNFRIESQTTQIGWMAAGDASSPINCNAIYWTSAGYRFNRSLEFKREGQGLGLDTHLRFDNQGTNNTALIWARSNVNKHRITSTSDDNLIFSSDVTSNTIMTMDGTNITIGQPATAYTLPAERGTIRQLLITDNNGGVTWQDPPNIFDQSLNTLDTPQFVGLGLNSSGNATIYLRHSGSLKWSIQNSQSQGDLLAIRDASTVERFSITQMGSVQIGSSLLDTHYKLPTARGTLNQILKTDSNGNVSWENPANIFDQSLNTVDDVAFNSVLTNSMRYKTLTGLVTVQTGGLEKHLDFSYNGGAGFAPLMTLDAGGSTIPTPLDVSGPLTASGDWIHNQCGSELYNDVNLSPTACVSANTPYSVVFGQAFIGFQHSFTAITSPPNAFRMTYTGVRSRRINISCTLSFETTKDSVIVNFFLYKNGLAIPGTKVTMFHVKGLSPQSTQIQSLPIMNTNDFIDIYTSCDTSNTDVYVTSANLQAFCLSNIV